MTSVLVLGGGVIGVCSAYYLAQRGHQVTVVDRCCSAAMETSFANGGQISASHSEPWATPSTPLNVLKWLGRNDAPLLYHLRADPALWAWSLRFLGNCLPGKARINTARMLRIALYSRKALTQLRQETGIEYDQQTRGILHIYHHQQEYTHAMKQAELMTKLGCERHPLDVNGCIALEPALGEAAKNLVGGIHCPGDESGDAYKFTVRLATICADMGVDFRYATTIKHIHNNGQKITNVETADGQMLGADNYVLALGSYSPLAARPLGIDLAIYPAKGYSLTMPITNAQKAPKVSITEDELKLVYSRLGNKLRIAGTAEFSGYDTSLDEARTRPILNAALKLFPGCMDADKAELWAGLRPSTPSGTPMIGATKYDNFFLNTGHGTLGWTMACGSGRALADIINGDKAEINMQGFQN